MKAWVTNAGKLELRETAAPLQGSDEMLVRVGAISLNRGEIRGVARAATGAIPGWDIAGIVERPAPNGKGPAAGTRVAALLNSGGWAELASVPIAHAAVIPDGVSLEQAATLPIAGMTLMRTFALAGSLIGKRVLITGERGGVGQFALQLAEIGGATVTGVRTADEAAGQYDLILESAGGASLAAAIERVARAGLVVTIGNSSEEETPFNARTLTPKEGPRSMAFWCSRSSRAGASRAATSRASSSWCAPPDCELRSKCSATGPSSPRRSAIWRGGRSTERRFSGFILE